MSPAQLQAGPVLGLITAVRKPDCVQLLPGISDHGRRALKARDRVFASGQIRNVDGAVGLEITADDNTCVVAQFFLRNDAWRIVTDSYREHAGALQTSA